MEYILFILDEGFYFSTVEEWMEGYKICEVIF